MIDRSNKSHLSQVSAAAMMSLSRCGSRISHKEKQVVSATINQTIVIYDKVF